MVSFLVTLPLPTVSLNKLVAINCKAYIHIHEQYKNTSLSSTIIHDGMLISYCWFGCENFHFVCPQALLCVKLYDFDALLFSISEYVLVIVDQWYAHCTSFIWSRNFFFMSPQCSFVPFPTILWTSVFYLRIFVLVEDCF